MINNIIQVKYANMVDDTGINDLGGLLFPINSRTNHDSITVWGKMANDTQIHNP